MSKGALLLARNNQHIDYVKQAVFLSKRIEEHLNIPVSIVTDSKDYLIDAYGEDSFDNIIQVEYLQSKNNRSFFDGSLSHKTAAFKNDMRADVYDLTPYEETLVLDTDYMISNSLLKNCFDSCNDLMMFRHSYDIAKVRDEREFDFITDYGIEFYWATVIFFRKNEANKIFFDLVKHIHDEWSHYRRVYQINSALFRNDFAFSIAVHIMNGFQKGDFVAPLPGKHYYTIDKDILYKLEKDKMMFLVEKENYIGEYTAISTDKLNVHVMNKFSLERIIDEVNT